MLKFRRLDNIFHGEEVDGFGIYVGKLGICGSASMRRHAKIHTCTCKHLRFQLLCRDIVSFKKEKMVNDLSVHHSPVALNILDDCILSYRVVS